MVMMRLMFLKVLIIGFGIHLACASSEFASSKRGGERSRSEPSFPSTIIKGESESGSSSGSGSSGKGKRKGGKAGEASTSNPPPNVVNIHIGSSKEALGVDGSKSSLPSKKKEQSLDPAERLSKSLKNFANELNSISSHVLKTKTEERERERGGRDRGSGRSKSDDSYDRRGGSFNRNRRREYDGNRTMTFDFERGYTRGRREDSRDYGRFEREFGYPEEFFDESREPRMRKRYYPSSVHYYPPAYPHSLYRIDDLRRGDYLPRVQRPLRIRHSIHGFHPRVYGRGFKREYSPEYHSVEEDYPSYRDYNRDYERDGSLLEKRRILESISGPPPSPRYRHSTRPSILHSRYSSWFPDESSSSSLKYSSLSKRRNETTYGERPRSRPIRERD